MGRTGEQWKRGYCDTWHGDACGQKSVQTTTIRRARKFHKCCECQHPIVPGEDYEHIKGIWDGDSSEYKTCLCCAKARCAIRSKLDLNSDECIIFGGLMEAMVECGEMTHAEAWPKIYGKEGS